VVGGSVECGVCCGCELWVVGCGLWVVGCDGKSGNPHGATALKGERGRGVRRGERERETQSERGEARKKRASERETGRCRARCRGGDPHLAKSADRFHRTPGMSF
jgi:hypothetical protein